MEKKYLKINKELLNEFSKKKFIKMTGDEKEFDRIYKEIENHIDPKCIFAIIKDTSTIEDQLIIEKISIKSDAFLTIPKEIIGDIAIFAMTIGDINCETSSVLDATLIDIIGTAYIDGLRDVLRLELEDNFLVGGLMAPGIEKMKIEEILKFQQLLNFEDIGISLNDSFTMIPEKSSTGLFMLFNEEHPVSTNSCETCMANGHGCNFCSAKDNTDV